MLGGNGHLPKYTHFVLGQVNWTLFWYLLQGVWMATALLFILNAAVAGTGHDMGSFHEICFQIKDNDDTIPGTGA